MTLEQVALPSMALLARSLRRSMAAKQAVDALIYTTPSGSVQRRCKVGVTAIPPSGGGVVEGRLFSLDAIFDKVVPFSV
jgi:hypothetical protein